MSSLLILALSQDKLERNLDMFSDMMIALETTVREKIDNLSPEERTEFVSC